MNYIPNAGQTYMPFTDNINIPTLPYTPLDRPEPPIPELELRREFKDRGYMIGTQCQHFIPGVTAKMLDWFWGNMEKCYYLWAPGSHKRFNWVRPPWQYGFEKSAHIISEAVGQGIPVFGGSGIQINRLALNEWFPFTTHLDHVICEGVFNDLGEFVDSTVHMWQDVPGGTIHITASVVNPNISEPPSFIKEILAADPDSPIVPPAATDHGEYEAAMWPRFLPQMYALWENHPDPSQSYPCDLTVIEKNGVLSYVTENGPIAL
ncbi:MAG: glycogen debranching protein [Ruminococcaceae bacterium]|nr:glycogen debranching protein [Oscillospiraceae bacterium]